LAGQAEAKSEYRLPQGTLALNRRKNNPRLDNRRLSRVLAFLPTRTRGGGMTLKRRPAFRRDDLQVLKERPKIEPPDPRIAITIDDAAEKAGVERSSIRLWMKEGHPGPNGTTLRLGSEGKHWIEVGGRQGTRLMEVIHLNRPNFDAILAFRNRGETRLMPYIDDGGTWYRLAYLTKTYGWIRVTLNKYRKHCKPLGRKITAKPIPKPVGAMGRPTEWGYHKDDVERLALALVTDQGWTGEAPAPLPDYMAKLNRKVREPAASAVKNETQPKPGHAASQSDEMITVSEAATRLDVYAGQITRAVDRDAIDCNGKTGMLRRVSWPSCQLWDRARAGTRALNLQKADPDGCARRAKHLNSDSVKP
jgi:hypothetical protein